jgi:hypothetical protein
VSFGLLGGVIGIGIPFILIKQTRDLVFRYSKENIQVFRLTELKSKQELRYLYLREGEKKGGKQRKQTQEQNKETLGASPCVVH